MTNSDNGDDSPCKKKLRLESSLNNLEFISLLKKDSSSKSIFIRCKLHEKDAILILQKLAFPNTPDVWQSILGQSNELTMKEVQANDIYSRYLMNISLEKLNEIDVTLICPAEQHHFDKYSSVGKKICMETPEMYKNKTLPFLSLKPKDLTWVQNILDGNSEVENVLFRDDDPKYGFVLVLDYKWNKKSLQNLHMLIIANDNKLTCLRDLNAEHLPMLKNMYSKCSEAVLSNFTKLTDNETNAEINLTKDDIFMFFHYPPTFYHLHVHLMHINSPIDGGSQIGRGHLLHDVIQNIEMKSDYYQEKTFQINLGESSPMLKALNKE